MLFENYESFLSELTKLFQLGTVKGNSVNITIKRYDGRTTRNPRKSNDKPKPGGKPVTSLDSKPTEFRCLIRAKLKSKKISVAVSAKDMNKFQVSYSNLIKGNVHILKKKNPQKQ